MRESADGELPDVDPSLSPAARCAIDTAILDAVARRRGTTVARLLGSSAVATVEASALLVGRSAEDVRGEARALAARGFRVLKLKIGTSLAQDLQRVTAARDGAGGTIRLRLDANRAWTREQARTALAALAAPDIDLVEEPLRDPDPETLSDLRTHGLPLALDESIRTADDVARLAAAGRCDAIVLKLVRLGGPRAALDAGRRALELGLRAVVTDAIETAVGRAAAAHVAAALPPPRHPVGLGGALLLERDVDAGTAPRATPIVAVDGPGLGIHLEEAPSTRSGLPTA